MIRRIPTSVPYDSNIYLVTGDRPVLVDAGTGLDSASVVEALRGYGAEPAAIVLTHCHFDHAGGAHALAEEFGCEVMAGRLDAGAVRSGDPRLTLCQMFGSEFTGTPVTELSEGDVVDTGEHSLRVIETPGHTPGGICLYEESTGYLLSGDTLFLDGVGRTDFPGGSYDDLKASLRRLSTVEIKGLFPGHEDCTEHYSPAMMAAVLRTTGV